MEVSEDKFKECLNFVASQPEGKIVLACIKEYCRFDNDIVIDGSPQDTYGNAILRRCWLYLRGRIDKRHLKSIEYDFTRKVEHGRRTDSTAGTIHSTGTLPGKAVGRKNKIR